MNEIYLIGICASLLLMGISIGKSKNNKNFVRLEIVARENGRLLHEKAMLLHCNDKKIIIDKDEINSIYESLLEEQNTGI